MMSGDAERIAPTYSLDREISRYVQQEILTNSQPTLDVYPGTAPIEYTVDACLFIEMCGSCCLFEIMIARTLKQMETLQEHLTGLFW
ncbi:hypothetical protein MSG28_015727 [Choristoneura fumiferana]|uniref:Uncharacterized protein n=1 Tax=Choristoneura fumiferana TaxID=7141 RepID=A0ACC0KBS4_CHOFU|nr:hypothetical protein MSG28_015727 [Choristoneura fumiferana]